MFTPEQGPFFMGCIIKGLSQDTHLSFAGRIQTPDNIQQGGLSGTGWSHQPSELSCPQGEVHILQCSNEITSNGETLYQGIYGNDSGVFHLLSLMIENKHEL